MSRPGHTCDRTSIEQCPICGPLAQRAGMVVTTLPQPKPTLPSLETRYPEEAFLLHLEAEGQKYGWQGEVSWMRDGSDPGLAAWLVRPPELLYVLILRAGATCTPQQDRWLAAVRKTAAEVVVWTVEDREAITERLARAPRVCR